MNKTSKLWYILEYTASCDRHDFTLAKRPYRWAMRGERATDAKSGRESGRARRAGSRGWKREAARVTSISRRSLRPCHTFRLTVFSPGPPRQLRSRDRTNARPLFLRLSREKPTPPSARPTDDQAVKPRQKGGKAIHQSAGTFRAIYLLRLIRPSLDGVVS
mgnify:CR=1 FL=1